MRPVFRYGEGRVSRGLVGLPTPLSVGDTKGTPIVRGDDRMIIGPGSDGSASRRYRGCPSGPISIIGGSLKLSRARYAGLISRASSSGSEEGHRKRPFSTSSTE